ncbi:MAG: hypothetical protein CL916_07870 [Deltaproteobacteria bacterium]|nr:hypothetical protein [Deltaproteobacteria bacterium]
MIATSHWYRLIDYLDRMGAPLLLHNRVKPQNDPAIFHGIQAPLEYLHFISTYGYPSLYIDDDMYLGFLSYKQSSQHQLFHCGVYPFAVCSLDLQITVVLEHDGTQWNVVVYEGLERVDVDGVFEEWMKGQVRQFLLELSNYDFKKLHILQFQPDQDPLLLKNPFRFSLTS